MAPNPRLNPGYRPPPGVDPIWGRSPSWGQTVDSYLSAMRVLADITTRNLDSGVATP